MHRDFDVPTLDSPHADLSRGSTADMRKGFGLVRLTRNRLFCALLSGHLFLFCNAQQYP
jgi:hypothetical protein